jgi:alpha-D-ribose 1-methylphosphonate 5-triphosphate synthase subunit PhnG
MDGERDECMAVIKATQVLPKLKPFATCLHKLQANRGMFHAFDNDGPNRPNAQPIARPIWMKWLARAPLDMLASALKDEAQHPPQWLRRPETGLYMVQGRAGGDGQRFNLGEMTVTRCALRAGSAQSDDAPVGVAYVLGRHHRRAELAALADALLQDEGHYTGLEATLLLPLAKHLAAEQQHAADRTASTRVDFFTVAREAGGSDEESST